MQKSNLYLNVKFVLGLVFAVGNQVVRLTGAVTGLLKLNYIDIYFEKKAKIIYSNFNRFTLTYLCFNGFDSIVEISFSSIPFALRNSYIDEVLN